MILVSSASEANLLNYLLTEIHFPSILGQIVADGEVSIFTENCIKWISWKTIAIRNAVILAIIEQSDSLPFRPLLKKSDFKFGYPLTKKFCGSTLRLHKKKKGGLMKSNEIPLIDKKKNPKSQKFLKKVDEWYQSEYGSNMKSLQQTLTFCQ